MSIVIAARNEATTIEAAIRSALDQGYPGPLEVIVADGESTDGTRAIVESVDDPRVVVLSNPAQYTAPGLNRAIRAARGEVIVRCDGHSTLPPEYVRTAVETMRATGAANVGGIQAATGTTFFSQAVALAMTSRLGVGDSRFHLGGPPGEVDTVYLGVFDRRPLEEVGLFDESLVRNQDYELNFRLRRAGHVVWFTPELAVEYRPRGSLVALWRQYFEYGRWKRGMLRTHPDAVRLRQLVPPLFVIGLAVSGILLMSGQTLLGAIVPLAYVATILTGAVWTSVDRRAPAAVLLPLVLPAMHLAWGCGFLLGPPSD